MDKIIIENLTVYSNHGVLPEEKKLGQKFLISAVLYTDTRKAGLNDDLSRTIDYSEVCRHIEGYVKDTTFDLIESVAEGLAMELLRETDRLEMIEITVSKPWAPVMLPVENLSISIKRGWHKAYLSIGSNMGDREAYLDMAVERFENDDNCYVAKVADYIETKPYGYEEQPDFLNGCIEIMTLYTPEELLKVCQEIELEAKRERLIKWGPRTLDVDILLYDDEIISTKNLLVPHPQMHLREFVLKPMTQIAPYIMHPILKKRISELLEELE